MSDASARVSRTCSLCDDVGTLRYVSGKRKGAIERLGLHRVRDLLLHIPHRYLDFSHVVRIGYATVGEDVTVIGRVDKIVQKTPRPKMNIVELYVLDDTGVLVATFFRQPWIAEQIKQNDVIALSGTVTFGYGFKQMKAPFHEVLSQDGNASGYARVLPVHSVGEGISVPWMRRIMSATLGDVGNVCDPMPSHLLAKHGLMGLSGALREVHFPASLASAEQARRRLAYDELLTLQLALITRQDVQVSGLRPFVHVIDGPHVEAMHRALPFALTDEQRVAAEQILADMAAPRVMNRLLLGDVGTGKTAVALVAVASVADTGTQAAFMAPTSVLARQYAANLGSILDAAGITWALITGSTPQAERSRLAEQVANGSICCVFGTTALLSESVSFKSLSLVVVDEQHRFGVNQRRALRQKGAAADSLTMSATPIPRTLALSIYGDLACSRIRNRPVPGAGITTKVVPPQNLDLAYGAIREAVVAGHQAYVICPLVDEKDDGSELDDVPQEPGKDRRLHAATTTLADLSQGFLRGMRLGLLTGRMSGEQKDEVMGQFASGDIDVLVSTTVVEVGVDVPNATVMLVYDADRFGLATLHQLRGRVGRGSHAGTVFLECVAKRGTPARKRLDALEATSDGLKLAELDLKLRHEGEVLGYRQHGGVSLRICDLETDADLVEAAHVEARRIAQEDPTLTSPLYACLGAECVDRYGAYFEEMERA